MLQSPFVRTPAGQSPGEESEMTKIQIELPEETAEAAEQAGLLSPDALERLLKAEISRRRAADRLLSIADRVADSDGKPMSLDELTAEVKADRKERRRRAGRR
jgi:hypothetical protein